MTSTIKVNTIQDSCGSALVSKCSSTITLGASGKTIALAAGASQTGFGRSGSVNWCTTAKTSPFTAENGKGYFVNTTSGVITVTLPASPSAGDIVAIKDYARTFGTNKVTLGRNSSKMDGACADTSLTTTGQSSTLVYVDATKGWQFVNDDTTAAAGGLFMAATGGTVSTSACGDFKVHTFTSSGTFCISCAGNPGGSNQIEYVVVAGGGSGGSENGQSVAGGGGGAGGFRFASPSQAPDTYPAKPLAGSTITASAGAIPITVGAGGAVNPTGTNAGSPSVFSTITSAGGGGGGYTGEPGPSGLRAGNAGGSGGGASHGESNPGPSGGAGNTPPVSPPQGNPGGGMEGGGVYLGAGGGGATAAGGQAPTSAAGPGGAGGGVPTAFGSSGIPCGSFRYFAGGGGGGGSTNRPQTGSAGTGGLGGGAAGGAGQNPAPAAATANTGGGGGGAGNLYPFPGTPITGSTGGSGIVILRYRFQ